MCSAIELLSWFTKEFVEIALFQVALQSTLSGLANHLADVHQLDTFRPLTVRITCQDSAFEIYALLVLIDFTSTNQRKRDLAGLGKVFVSFEKALARNQKRVNHPLMTTIVNNASS